MKFVEAIFYFKDNTVLKFEEECHKFTSSFQIRTWFKEALIYGDEEVEEIEKAIERCETLPKVCQDMEGKEITKDDDRYVNECNDYKYCGKNIELDGEKKYLSHTTGDTLNAMGTFIFLFIMSAVYLFTSIFLGYAGGFFRSKP